MTVRQLIDKLQKLGEKNLDKEVWMFDGPTYYTPYRVKIIDESMGLKNKTLLGGIMID